MGDRPNNRWGAGRTNETTRQIHQSGSNRRCRIVLTSSGLATKAYPGVRTPALERKSKTMLADQTQELNSRWENCKKDGLEQARDKTGLASGARLEPKVRQPFKQ